MDEAEKYFLKLDGIMGDSTDPGHAGWIDLESWTWHSDSTAGGSSGSGGGAGKTDFRDFAFTSRPGRQSPELARASQGGQYIESGVLEVVRGTGCKRTVAVRLHFTDVLIANYRYSGSDQVTMSFGGLRFETGSPSKCTRRTSRPVARPIGRVPAL